MKQMICNERLENNKRKRGNTNCRSHKLPMLKHLNVQPDESMKALPNHNKSSNHAARFEPTTGVEIRT